METERKIIERAGYKQYFSDTWLRMRHCDVLFQKCVRDINGKKYFINLNGYAPNPEYHREQWQWTVEVNINEPHLQFDQHGPITTSAELELFEQRCETFWQAMGQPYYERWDTLES